MRDRVPIRPPANTAFKSPRDPVESSRKRALGAPVGSVMGGEESRRERGAGARMLLLRAEECLLCLALDAVIGVFPSDDGAHRVTAPIVDWASISGFDRGENSPTARGSLVLVRTDSGTVGLRADDCLGVRDISFLESAPIPARLLDEESRPLFYLLMVDGQPHFLIEPQALARAAKHQEPSASAVGSAPLVPHAYGA